MNVSILVLFALSLILLCFGASEDSTKILSRFQQYLKIDTSHPTPDYYEAVDFLVDQASSLKLDLQVIEFVRGKPIVIMQWRGKVRGTSSLLLNSHYDVSPADHPKWARPPFDAQMDQMGNIYARGSQDSKCIGLQYLEAIRELKQLGFEPDRTIFLSFVPDGEIGGHDGAEKLANSDFFKKINVGIVLDEGLPSSSESYRIFYGESRSHWLVSKVDGGSKFNGIDVLLNSIESVRRFIAAQNDMVKAQGQQLLISFNIFLKAVSFDVNSFHFSIRQTGDRACLERQWASALHNMTYELGQFIHNASVSNEPGKPILNTIDSSSPWWALLEEAVKSGNKKIGEPEIFPISTAARFFRDRGVPTIGFSPIANTPILLHNHNEFLNRNEYLKGIEIYKRIIRFMASFG